MTFPVARRAKEKPARPFYGAFDSETLGLDGELLLITATYETPVGSTPVELFRDAASFVAWILEDEARQKVIWYAHNAEYDWRYLLEVFAEYTSTYDIIPKLRGGDKIFEIEFRIKGTKKTVLKMRDSLALFPFSLKKFAGHFSDQAKLDIGLAEGVMFDVNNPTHIEYAKRDVEVLLECMINFDALVYEHYGVHLKGTIAGTSYQAWLRHIPEGQVHWRMGREAEDFVRRGYFGGIVYIRHINQTIPKVKTFDINSSYPDVMERFGVPVGNGTFTDEYVAGVPGFYEVFVDATSIADDRFHFVPFRAKSSVCWARGTFNTVITSAEYEAAIAYGYKLEVLNGIVFEDGIEYPFNDYVAISKMLRNEYKGQALEQVAKLMQNSLYGKFGMAIVGMEYIFALEAPDEDGWSSLVDIDTGRVSDYIYSKEVEREASYMLPHWAAWITAHARLELLKKQQIAGDEYFYYADTDSITIDPRGEEALVNAGLVGKEYGDLKDEGFKYDWICRGPKAYSYRNSNGEYEIKMKGIPKKGLTVDQKERIHNGEMVDVHFHVSRGILATVKTHKLGYDTHRRPTDCRNLQSWSVNDNMTIAYPRLIEDERQLSLCSSDPGLLRRDGDVYTLDAPPCPDRGRARGGAR